MLGRFITCLCMLALYDVTSGQTDEEIIAAIDTFIQDIMTSEQMVGLGVAVVREGRPLMAEGYGIKDVVDIGTVTNDTLWYLASCSKALNAALISKILSEDGRYDFDTRVHDIWPEFAMETGFRSEHITIRDVISHRTGTADSLFQILAGAMESREDYINRSRFFPAIYPFRDAEAYNNVMVTIGGYMVEQLTGLTWEEALKTHIIDPLGMTQTTFVDRMTSEEYDAMASGHENDQDTGLPRPVSKVVFGPNLGPATPSGGIMTCATDVQKWLLFLTNKGLAEDGSRVMNESDIMRTMTETSLAKYPPTNENPRDEIVRSETGVALGWYNGLYRGYNMATHNGYFFGFHSSVTVLQDIGMAVYTNINSGDGYVNGSVQLRVHEFVLDTLLGVSTTQKAKQAEKLRLLSSSAKSQDQQQLSKDENLEFEFEDVFDSVMHQENENRDKHDYTGTYGNFIFGNMSIFYNETEDYLWGSWGTLARMELIGSGDQFIGNVLEPLWFAPPLVITFTSSNNDSFIDEMTIPFLLPQAPPTFIRDLKLSDAPPPPVDSCEDPPLNV